jgi:DNA-directed RNA polymerase specialized sigma24 family protein
MSLGTPTQAESLVVNREGVGLYQVVAVASEAAFEAFVAAVEPRLRRALVAAFGAHDGREATADALAWAWEHWDAVQTMGNPGGYLYRVGRTSQRTRTRAAVRFPPPPQDAEVWVEPALPAALDALTESQRVAVVLVHGFGWTLAEVADFTRVKVTTVQNHVERGMAKLRKYLEVGADA